MSAHYHGRGHQFLYHFINACGKAGCHMHNDFNSMLDCMNLILWMRICMQLSLFPNVQFSCSLVPVQNYILYNDKEIMLNPGLNLVKYTNVRNIAYLDIPALLFCIHESRTLQISLTNLHALLIYSICRHVFIYLWRKQDH